MSIASKLAGVAAAAALAGSVSPAHGQDGHDAWFYIGAAAGHVEYSQAERYYAPFRTYPWSDEVTIDLVAESGVDLARPRGRSGSTPATVPTGTWRSSWGTRTSAPPST